MNEEDALRALDERKREFVSRIPANAPSLRTRYLGNVVEDEFGAAQKHLRALYASGFEVGPDLAAAKLPSAHPKYAFWIEGIQRHIARCEAIITDQPAGN